MQRIEADAVRAQVMGKLDQALEVGKIAHAPVACRAHAVQLHRQEPAAVEIAAEGLRGCDNQRQLLADLCGIGQLQPIDPVRQILRPPDRPIAGLAFGDNLKPV